MSSLVERLRDGGNGIFDTTHPLGDYGVCDEAANEIERLREALRPFADKAKQIDGTAYWTEQKGAGYTVAIPLGACRAAAAALRTQKDIDQ